LGYTKPETQKLWRKKNPDKYKAIVLRAEEKRKIRMLLDPEYAKHKRSIAKKSYDKRKNDPLFIEQRKAIQFKNRSKLSYKLKIKNQKLLKWLSSGNFTLEDYNKMLLNGCNICGCKDKKLYKDHDHKTNKARGLLCNKCNVSLGWFERNRDNINIHIKEI